jgi:hypothetical protein
MPPKSPVSFRLPTLAEIARPISHQIGPITGLTRHELNERSHEIIRRSFLGSGEIPSLQRRIYDVLSVIRALDSLHAFQPLSCGKDAISVLERIRRKEIELQKKRLMRAQYEWIIDRNRTAVRPGNAIGLPVIIVVIGGKIQGSVERSFDQRSIVVRIAQYPRFMGPCEIVGTLRETQEKEWKSVGIGTLKSKGNREERKREKEEARVKE